MNGTPISWKSNKAKGYDMYNVYFFLKPESTAVKQVM